jgi:hypothetical protein
VEVPWIFPINISCGVCEVSPQAKDTNHIQSVFVSYKQKSLVRDSYFFKAWARDILPLLHFAHDYQNGNQGDVIQYNFHIIAVLIVELVTIHLHVLILKKMSWMKINLNLFLLITPLLKGFGVGGLKQRTQSNKPPWKEQMQAI